MKVIVIFCCFILFFSESGASELVTLEDLKWKNRIIICLTNDQKINDSLWLELKKNDLEIIERDIVYFLISPATVLSNSGSDLSLEDMGELIHEYYDNDDSLKILLIGKDGGVKIEMNKLDLEYIFRLIDSMPMRLREMKSK